MILTMPISIDTIAKLFSLFCEIVDWRVFYLD